MKSGAGLKAAVGERGDRLCVGEPGRLSPEDRERLREVKLRLVCSRGEGCMAKRLNTDLRLQWGTGGENIKSSVINYVCKCLALLSKTS